jgi:transcriptional regulator with XRE-family HTH domain
VSADTTTGPVSPLRAARIARGLTLQDVAFLAGIDKGHLSKVERGEKRLSVESLYRLTVALELDEFAALLRPCVSAIEPAEALGVTSEELDTWAPGQGASGPGPVTVAVVAALRSARQSKKVSARELAERMTALGYPVGRSAIANIESGRRPEISVDHLAFAAQALEVDAPAVLRAVVSPCPQCHGAPPAGFTCNTCGGA